MPEVPARRVTGRAGHRRIGQPVLSRYYHGARLSRAYAHYIWNRLPVRRVFLLWAASHGGYPGGKRDAMDAKTGLRACHGKTMTIARPCDTIGACVLLTGEHASAWEGRALPDHVTTWSPWLDTDIPRQYSRRATHASCPRREVTGNLICVSVGGCRRRKAVSRDQTANGGIWNPRFWVTATSCQNP